jgi:diguanylate cyclase (GGDEF)-like protein
MPLYDLISRLPGPRNFALKIFLFSFITTQLPMFLLLLYVALNVEMTTEMIATISFVLIAAILGCVSTVIVLKAYAEPVNAISRAVHNFAYADDAPNLPDTYSDEIGELMANTQGALKKLHSMLHNMHELSIRDELTGLYNRRFFSDQADMLVIRAIRYEEPLALVYIDVDDFKAVNDRFTHLVGDHALRQLASILTSTARGSDLIARLGGDEFVWILPNTTATRARQICDRLQTNLQEHDWTSLLEDLPLTVSIGIAEVEDLDTLEKLMGRADSNLFKAKKSGRGQAAVA